MIGIPEEVADLDRLHRVHHEAVADAAERAEDHHVTDELGRQHDVRVARMEELVRAAFGVIGLVEDFFADVPDGPLKQTALSIISAWYLGVATDAPDAEVFAYEYALMYQPTRDVMTIPSYAISGPNGWTAEGPPLSNMPEF